MPSNEQEFFGPAKDYHIDSSLSYNTQKACIYSTDQSFLYQATRHIKRVKYTKTENVCRHTHI